MHIRLKAALREVDKIRGMHWSMKGWDTSTVNEASLSCAELLVPEVFTALNAVPVACMVYSRGILLVRYKLFARFSWRETCEIFFHKEDCTMSTIGLVYGMYGYDPDSIARLVGEMKKKFKYEL